MRVTSHFTLKAIAGLALGLCFSLCCIANPTEAEVLAIVVHPDTVVDELTQEQLTRIFRAEQQFWPDNSRITLLIRAPVSAVRTTVLEKIYHMTEAEFRKFWIAKMFKAEVPSGPRAMYTSGMAISLVSAIPGAITFIPLSNVPENGKILKVDGKLPGQAGYQLIL